MSTLTSSETLSTYWRKAARKYTAKNLMDLQINVNSRLALCIICVVKGCPSKSQNNNISTFTNKIQSKSTYIKINLDQKKNIKPQKISKNKIKDMRKMTRFQRLKNRLDAINWIQRPEDCNNITKSSEVESDGRQTPFNNYTIKVKGEREGIYFQFCNINQVYFSTSNRGSQN